MERNKEKNEQARVHRSLSAHGTHNYSRSPTRTVDDMKKRQQLSKSFSGSTSSTVPMSQMPEIQQTTFSAQMVDACARPKYQPDVMKGDVICFTMTHVNAEKIKQEVTVRRSCAVEEYMKWKFILSQPAHLEQFNVNIKKELGISGEITPDSCLHLNKRLNNLQTAKDMCDRLVDYAMDSLCKGLHVLHIPVKPNQADMYIKQIANLATFTIYTEVIQDQLYVVSMNREKKQVTECIRYLVQGESKQIDRIFGKTIWNKMACLIDLEKLLKEACPALEITLTREPDKFVISLNGPEAAMDIAKQEFARLNDRLVREKCCINVTLRHVLSELQVEHVLDENLLKQGLKCATCQIKEGIYVYGFNDECLKTAKTKIESTIIEKPYVIKGDLKANSDILISYVKCKWPGLVVIHIGDSGHLHIVGIKQCVDETYQIITDLKNGKVKLEELLSRQKNEVTTQALKATTETQSDEDGRQDGRETLQYANQIHTQEDESREHGAGIRKDNLDERKTKENLKKKQKASFEAGKTHDGADRRMTNAGHIYVVEEGCWKHTDDNKHNKEDIEDTHREKQNVLEASMIDKQRKFSKTKDSENRDLNFIDKNTDTKAVEVNACKKKQTSTDAPKMEKHQDISTAIQSDISECMDFSDEKICQFMMKPDSRIFLKECANENKVTIYQYINRGIGIDGITVEAAAVITPKSGVEHTIKWKTTEQKTMMLTLTKKVEDLIERGNRFVKVKFKKHRHEYEPVSTNSDADKGVTVTVRIPKWIDGKEHNTEKLTDLLTEFIEAMEQANADCVLLPLDTVGNWPIKDFVQCVVSIVVGDIFLNTRLKKPHVVLYLDDGTYFDRVFAYTEGCIRKCLKAQQAKHNRLKVSVIAGGLDKTKADVIVNTTSWDLDLSNGKVSAALLKAAGSSIQKECRQKYPNGISRLAIAVTKGHELACNNVFHIALDRYIAQKEMNSIESIRSLMMTCLETASDMKHQTIAFPAVGTGVLKYPIDLVSSVMFESVERFKSMHKDTSLTTVYFVIYPTDVKVMEIFRKNEETLEEKPENKCISDHRKSVQVRISGQRENIMSAKSCILERCEDERYGPLEIHTASFPGVPYQDFLAVKCLFEDTMKKLFADGVEVKYRDDNLVLSGKPKELRRASEKMKDLLQQISQFSVCSLSVRDSSTETVDDEIQRLKREQDVHCVFDKYHYIVHIYARSGTQSRKCMSVFEKNLVKPQDPKSLVEKKALDSRSSPPSVYGEKRHTDSLSALSSSEASREAHECAQESSFRSKANTDIKEKLKKHRKSNVDNNDLPATHQLVSTKLSLTQNAKYCKTFRMDNILVRVYEADILDVPVDCIVNPANQNLDHQGGLASLIVTAAGHVVETQCRDILMSKGGPLPVTSVVITTAGRLKYRYILHAIGPCWNDYTPMTEARVSDCLDDLRNTVINCLIHAEKHGMETIALSTISSGLFGVPKELCAIQYVSAIQDFGPSARRLKEIHIVDVSHEMISIVHSICDSTIDHGRAVSIELKHYIDTPSKVDRDDKTRFKSTGRDKPGKLKSDKETKQIVTNTDRNQETYAEDGMKLVCSFSSNHVVQIYEGNILTLQGIQALVCSDNRNGEAKGEISKQLLQTNGEEYGVEKSKHFKEKHNYGDIVVTSGGNSNFECILHAITPRQNINALHMMYINLFEEIVKKNVSCIALPLLGTGKGKYGPDNGAEVLLEEWANFCYKRKGSPLTIHLVLREKTISDLVKDSFRKYIDGTQKFDETPIQLQEEQLKQIEKMETNTDSDINSEDTEEEDCVICMDRISEPKKLKCGHTFCTECIEGYFHVKKVCPTCGHVCGVITGDQPDGRMEILKIKSSCVGYEGHKAIALSYFFHSGTQGEEHPRPGAYYRSISRTGYLPDTKEGREVCAMLKVAFERRLVFTIGTSRTTGEEDVITWNDIHHKTDMRPNTQFGYPDKTYLQRVREELAVKGVTEIDIEDNFVKELKADNFRRTISTDTTL